MSIPELFIRRPVATILVMFGILVFGVAGYRALPVSDLPNVDFPTIQVQREPAGRESGHHGRGGGAAAGEAVLDHRRPRFDVLAKFSGQDEHHAAVCLEPQYRWRGAGRAGGDYPGESQSAAEPAGAAAFSKVNPADFPVLFLVLTSPTLPLSNVDEYAETLIAQSISTVNGVAQVQVFGGQKYAVRVQVDPQALATRQIGIDEVEQALEDGNVNLPTGTLWGPHQAVNVEATGQLFNGARLRAS